MKLHGAVWRAAQGFEPAKLASLLCLGRLMREAVVSRFWGLVFVGCALPWCLFALVMWMCFDFLFIVRSTTSWLLRLAMQENGSSQGIIIFPSEVCNTMRRVVARQEVPVVYGRNKYE